MAKEDDNQAFCPNCGAKLEPGAIFCGKCGFDVRDFFNKQAEEKADQPVDTPVAAADDSTNPKKDPFSNQSDPVQQPVSSTNQSNNIAANTVHETPKRPTNKKKYSWKVYAAIAVVVLLIIGYVGGKTYYSPENQLNRTMTGIQKGKQGIYKDFESTTTKLTITDKSLKPLTKYLKANPNKATTMKSELSAGNYTGTAMSQFTYVQDGKVLLFFPKYKIKVTPVYATLKTNHSGIKLYLDGKQVGTSTSSYYTKSIGPLVPGTYNLKSTGTVSGNAMKNDNDNDILTNSSYPYDLSLQTVSFDVTSYANAVAYINGKKVGTLDDTGRLSITDKPWTSGMKLNLKYKTGDGQTITSNTKTISSYDDGEEVSVGFPGVISHSNAESLFNEVFQYVDNISSTGDNDNASEFAALFVNGTGNSDYSELVKMAKGYKNDSGIESVSYEASKLHVVPEKKNLAQVSYNVKYTFYDNSDSGSGEHTQVYSYVAHVAKSGSSYKITSIDPSKLVSDESSD